MRVLLQIVLIVFVFGSCDIKKGKPNIKDSLVFICPPCDQSCDELTWHQDGVCEHCKMNLVMRPDSSRVNDAQLVAQSGNFFTRRSSDDDRWVQVFYHRPPTMDIASKVLIVLPGAGRDGDQYRDAWADISIEKDVVVLALKYPSETYDFGAYHMAGMIDSVSFDKDFGFVQVDDQASWIFNDFDRIFNMVTTDNSLEAKSYDIFGHSAGGQILHRFALFHDDSKADRIIAANSGWYTLPDTKLGLPYGIKNTKVDEVSITKSYSKKLTIMVGEKDDATETRGTLLQTDSANEQGAHRLERAHNFYNYNQSLSESLNTPYNWGFHVISGVGHDYEKMSLAAGDILYK